MSGFCTGCATALRADDRFCPKCGRPRAIDAMGDVASAQQNQFEQANAAVDSIRATHGPAPAFPPAPRKKSPAAILPAMVGLLVVGIGVFVVSQGGGCGESVEGQFAVAGGTRPAFTFRPTGCVSMQPMGRFGANLHGDDANDGAVYVTMDPIRGPEVDIEIPGSCRNANGTDCTVFPLPRDRCTVFRATVDYTGVTVNDVRQVEGSVAVDCALEDGTTVRGNATFGGC